MNRLQLPPLGQSCQREHQHAHGEVLTDTRAWACPEWKPGEPRALGNTLEALSRKTESMLAEEVSVARR